MLPFHLFLLSIFSIIGLQAEESPSSHPYLIENKATLPILTPDLKERKIWKMRLPNGLEAVLISDPKTEMSGALLSMRTGSLNDPPEYLGLAHFLEHMLFLGTQKYPEESGYQRYIAENGGITNAFTSHESTNYFFSVNNGGFDQALDRFGHFFIDPLFNPSGVARELQAIDQEYGIKLENESWRILSVDKALANPQHPYHQFHIGNSTSLAPVSQEALKQWYRQHYSANLMRLVVYSSESLEHLYKLVETIFSQIPNSNLPISTYPTKVRNISETELIVIEPIKEVRKLVFTWEISKELGEKIETKPDSFACHILGHEGEHSLLALLKKEHLAEKIQCGSFRLSASNYEFSLDIELTEEGVRQVEKVIHTVFQAISFFAQSEIPPYLFDELNQMDRLNYQYQPRVEVVEDLMKQAYVIWDEGIESFPEKSHILTQFNPEDLQALFKELKPQNTRFFLSAPQKLVDVKLDQLEKWFNVKYGKQPLKLNWEVINQRNPSIEWPEKNAFIPSKISIKETKKNGDKGGTLIKGDLPVVETLINDEWGTVYFASDSYFAIPQTVLIFEIKTPQIDIGNVGKTVLADLYIKAVEDRISSLKYAAGLAGLHFYIERTQFGIRIQLDGWTQNLPLLFEEILNQLKVRPSESMFKIYAESARMEYQNFQRKLPIQQAVEYLNSLLYKKYSLDSTKLKALGKVTYFKFLDYVQHLYNQIYIEGMIYGTLSKEQSFKITNQVIHAFQSIPYTKGKEQYPHLLMLKPEEGPFYFDKTTPAQGNAALLVLEYPMENQKTRAAQQIAIQALKEAFFATLRTKQQTGYFVFSDGKEIERQLLNYFGVQSKTHDPRDLLARFELFLESFLQELPIEINEARFDTIKQSLLQTLEQPQKDIEEVGGLLFKLAFEYQGDFNWMKKRIQGFYDLTYSEFLKTFKEIFGRKNKRRIAILIQGTNSKEELLEYQKVNGQAPLRKDNAFTDRKVLNR